MKTRILSTLIVIGVVATFAAGSSLATFNDVESSMDNVFQSGELDIMIGWEEFREGQKIEQQSPMNQPGQIFDVKGIQPGESGSAAIEMKNIGNPAYIGFYANQTDSSENGFVDKTKREGDKKIIYSEPRTSYSKGELGKELEFKLWYDDGDGTKESNEEIIFRGEAHELGEYMDKGYLLDAGQGEGETQPYDKGSSHIGFKWKLPKDVDCEAQTDSKTFDFMFNAKQSRHNDEKTLSPLAYFGDREISSNNYFQAGIFDKCAKVKEKKERKVCKPIKKPGPGKEHVDRRGEKKGHSQAKYRVKKPSSKVIQFTDADEPLGHADKYEEDTFDMEVDGTHHDTIHVELKTWKMTKRIELDGEGDKKRFGEKDLWKAEVVDADSGYGETDYMIQIGADNEKDKLGEMDHVEFKFCETETYYEERDYQGDRN